MIESLRSQATESHPRQAVVKPPRFYYDLTTIHVPDLPHFAGFCIFGLFSWQNESPVCRQNIAVNRGKTEHIRSVRKDWFLWFVYFSFAMVGYSFSTETFVFTGLPEIPGGKLGHFWDSWRTWYSLLSRWNLFKGRGYTGFLILCLYLLTGRTVISVGKWYVCMLEACMMEAFTNMENGEELW